MDDERRGLYLHLGAHRTGTGSFQDFLARNSGRLEDHGVNLAVSNRDGDGRSSLKLRLPDRRHFRTDTLDEHRTWLDEQITKRRLNRRRISLISEENIPGTINTLMGRSMYPIVRERLGFMTGQLTKPVRAVLFGLRSYDSFFISLFHKRAEFRGLDPFDTYIDDLMAMERNWVDVVRDIQVGSGAETVHVFRFEDRPTHVAKMRILLASLPEDGWILPDGPRNLSATSAGIRALQARFHAGDKLSSDDVTQIIADHADDTSAAPVAAFSDAQRDALRAQYADDVETIRSMEGVVFHDPAGG